MWENREQRIGKFSIIFLYAMLWSMGVGPDLGHAQTKNQQGEVCRKTQVATQLIHLERYGQTENHAQKALEGDTQKIIDLEFQSDINAQWAEMMRELKEGDQEGTLRFISTNQREAARKEWPMLKKYLGHLTEHLSEPLLHLTPINDNQIVAQATMPSPQASLQCPLAFNFVLDPDGQWRLAYD